MPDGGQGTARPAVRVALMACAVGWLIGEWAIGYPTLSHQGFRAWHEAALGRLRHDPAFQVVVMDYFLTYAVAFGLSVREARRLFPCRWPFWAIAFLLFTAPAMLLFWAARPPSPRRHVS